MQPYSAATELVDAVNAIGAVEKLTALSVGEHNPEQLTAVRSRLIRKALHAAVVAARYALPPPVAREELAPTQETALPSPVAATAEPAPDKKTETLRAARAAWEKDWLTAQLAAHGGFVAALARTIGMERAALCRKLDDLGVAKRPYRRKDTP